MINTNQILEYLTVNKNYLKTKYFIDKIGLVGSYARGDYNEQSNIDLIVYFTEEAQKHRIFRLYIELQDEISEKFKKSVDIIANGKVLPAFKDIVEKEAVYV